jgi:hypothetical protein
LLLRRERGVERYANQRPDCVWVLVDQVVGLEFDFPARIFDFFLSGEEKQHIARLLGAVYHQYRPDSSLNIIGLRLLRVEHLQNISIHFVSTYETTTSTGKVLPGTLKSGAVSVDLRLKYFWNFNASRVADMMMILRSARFFAKALRRPMRISVASVRSCASSRMIVE